MMRHTLILTLLIGLTGQAQAQAPAVGLVDVLLYHYDSTIEWTVESDSLSEEITGWSHLTIAEPSAETLSAYLTAPSAELRVFAQVRLEIDDGETPLAQADVEPRVRALCASPCDADAVWSRLSPPPGD